MYMKTLRIFYFTCPLLCPRSPGKILLSNKFTYFHAFLCFYILDKHITYYITFWCTWTKFVVWSPINLSFTLFLKWSLALIRVHLASVSVKFLDFPVKFRLLSWDSVSKSLWDISTWIILEEAQFPELYRGGEFISDPSWALIHTKIMELSLQVQSHPTSWHTTS